MGTKKPDVVCAPPDPMMALTAGEMLARKWQVRAVCTACRIALWVELDHVVRIAGADTLMWGARGRCRVWKWGDHSRCNGVVVFDARSITGGSWRKLALTDQVRQLWWARQNPGIDPAQAAFDAARRRRA